MLKLNEYIIWTRSWLHLPINLVRTLRHHDQLETIDHMLKSGSSQVHNFPEYGLSARWKQASIFNTL